MAGLDDMTATLPPSMRLPTPLVIRPVGSRKRPCSCVFVATVCNCQRTLEYVLASALVLPETTEAMHTTGPSG